MDGSPDDSVVRVLVDLWEGGGKHVGPSSGALLLREFFVRKGWTNPTIWLLTAPGFSPGQQASPEDRWRQQVQAFLSHWEVHESLALTALNAPRTLVFGGDHSSSLLPLCAFLHICGVERTQPGILWVDAHLDMNNPWTTPSWNLHGMPVYVLLGAMGYLPRIPPDDLHRNQPRASSVKAWHQLLDTVRRCIGDVAFPSVPIFFVGVRAYEWEEIQMMRRSGFAGKVHAPSGFPLPELLGVLAEWIQRFRVDTLYVSVDVDVLDAGLQIPSATPEPGGPGFSWLQEFLRLVVRAFPVRVLDFEEANPLAGSSRTFQQWGELIWNTVQEWMRS